MSGWRGSDENRNLDGYELLHLHESSGSDFFGLKIFVKMSARKLDDDEHYHDETGRAIRALETALQVRTAQLDPKGAEMRELYHQEITTAYEKAGVTAIYMEPLPNGYCSRPCCLNRPWFKVTSSIGHIVIGRRKHVWSIDWKETTIKKTGEELFPAEDVTRWEAGIHAWSLEKVTEYLGVLHVDDVRRAEWLKIKMAMSILRDLPK